MSQAIQLNAQLPMVRQPQFLHKADSLTPELHRQPRLPLAVINAVADPQALFGWRAEPLCSLEALYQREFSEGESVIIDFGTASVICSLPATAPGARRMPPPICNSPLARHSARCANRLAITADGSAAVGCNSRIYGWTCCPPRLRYRVATAAAT